MEVWNSLFRLSVRGDTRVEVQYTVHVRGGRGTINTEARGEKLSSYVDRRPLGAWPSVHARTHAACMHAPAMSDAMHGSIVCAVCART
jgi:hypothetical protein